MRYDPIGKLVNLLVNRVRPHLHPRLSHQHLLSDLRHPLALHRFPRRYVPLEDLE